MSALSRRSLVTSAAALPALAVPAPAGNHGTQKSQTYQVERPKAPLSKFSGRKCHRLTWVYPPNAPQTRSPTPAHQMNAPTHAGPPPLALARPLPPGEADRKLQVINQAADLFGPGMQAIVDQGPSLLSGAWNAFKDQKNNSTYTADLRAYIEMIRSTVRKTQELRQSHPEYSDISSAIGDHYPLEAAADNFRQAYELMTVYLSPSIENQHFEILIRPFSAPFERDIRKFSEWRNNVQNQLTEIRRQTVR